MESLINCTEEQQPTSVMTNSRSNQEACRSQKAKCAGGFVLVHAGESGIFFFFKPHVHFTLLSSQKAFHLQQLVSAIKHSREQLDEGEKNHNVKMR